MNIKYLINIFVVLTSILFFPSGSKTNIIMIGETGATLTAINFIEKETSSNTVNDWSDKKIVAIEFLLDNRHGSTDIDFAYLSGIGIKIQDTAGYFFTTGVDNYSSEIKPLFPINNKISKGKISRGWITFNLPVDVKINEIEFTYEDSAKNISSEWGSLSSITMK